MSTDDDRAPPESEPEENVYVKNEEGEARMAGREGGDKVSAEGSLSFVEPTVYGLIAIVGLALLLFPEPATSLVGLILLGTGLFLAAIDFLGA